MVSKEIENRVLELNAQGIAGREIVRRMDSVIHYETVRNILRRNGLVLKKPKHNCLKGLEQIILKMYSEGYSQIRISKELGLHQGTVQRFLSDNVKTRSRIDQLLLKSPYKHNCFDALGSDPTANYFAGFLATDGCLDSLKKGSYRVRFSLKSTDVEMVEKMAEFIGGKVSFDQRKQSGRPTTYAASTHAYSKQMFDALVSHGITPRKSNTIKVSDQLAACRHFWRGAFDGDGCFYERGGHISSLFCSGSLKFISQFRDFLKPYIPNWTGNIQTEKINKPNRNNLYRFSLGYKSTTLLSEILYSDCQQYLARKFAFSQKSSCEKIKKPLAYGI